jgi:DNA modification methylase
MKMNKIYNESCLDTMSRMSDNFIDLTVTSPPYDNLRTYNDGSDKTWGEHIWKPILQELYRVTKEGGVVVWVVGDATINGSETGVSFKQTLYAMECGFNLHDTMMYYKKNYPYPQKNRYANQFEYMFVFSKNKPLKFNPIRVKKAAHKFGASGYRQKDGSIQRKITGNVNVDTKAASNVWQYAVGLNGSTSDKMAFEHPAIFPEKLAHDHIISWSNEGDVVYDPFMGSGTTAKMSKSTKRNYIGSEISEEYVNLANRRIAEMPQTLF